MNLNLHGFNRTFLSGVLAGLALLAVTGCDRNEIKVYRVAKESDAPMETAMPAASGEVPPISRPRLTWKTPEAWTEVPPGEMRLASFNVKGPDGKQADMSIVPLPGLAGGDAPNVNRWRGQVGLPPVTPEELEQSATIVEAGGQPAKLYELAGTNTSSGDPTQVLGAIQHRDGTAWFFKMTGDDQAVAAQKPAFIELLKSLDFAAAAPAALPPDHPPIGGADMMGGAPAAGAISSEGKPNWQVPADWTEVPGGQFLVAKFTIAGAGEAKAAVNVSSSAGDGGGLASNVNRWRKQLGLAEFSAAELATEVKALNVAAGRVSLVEFSGTDARSGQPSRLVGAMIPQNGQTWFYKLMGDPAVVESQKAAFTAFVQGVKY